MASEDVRGDEALRAQAPSSLRIQAALGNLGLLRRFVRARATALGADPRRLAAIVLAVDEAAANVILHGYRGADGFLEVDVVSRSNGLVVRLRDWAPPFDPLGVAAPDVHAPLEKREPGGLGVHLLRQSVDDVSYRRTPDGANELTLVWRRVSRSCSEPACRSS